ncbi:hypothetical protein C1645_840830 [Glomus cerebriforme]|uniref:Uncharacterized protein n=1 Tax=Glomus cerebriforme TaxID=658196 RepID=A0A397S9I1_9GLOM|nr:hypothetical protein C1645_840830 [Glomus cerebriforme]
MFILYKTINIVISKTLEEPYFKCEVRLDQNLKNSVEILSSVITQLLEKVKLDISLTELYRIEVKFDNHKKVLEFCVSLKTMAWYNVFLKGKPNTIKIAQDYITNAEKQFPPKPTKTKVNVKDEDDELDFDAFNICPQYKKKGECKCSELSSDIIHSDYNFSFCL